MFVGRRAKGSVTLHSAPQGMKAGAAKMNKLAEFPST